jgi:pentatricopeptide repeat protein
VALVLFVAAAALVVGVFASYWRVAATADYFALDSQRNIYENNNLHVNELTFSELMKTTQPVKSLETNRPLAFISFGLNYYFSGYDQKAFRLTNVAILAFCGVGVLLFAYLLVRRFAEPDVALAAAVFAAAFWTLHPLNINITTYIVQRMALMSITGYVWGFVFYLLGERGNRWWWAGAFLFGLAGILSKETAWYLPLAIATYRFAWDAKVRDWLWARKGMCAALLCALVVIVVAVAWQRSAIYEARDFTLYQRLLTQGRVLWLYAGLFFLPLPGRFNLDYDYVSSVGLFSPAVTFVALFLHLLVFASALWLWRRNRFVSLMLLLYYGHHVMESSFLGLELVFEHRMCLPSLFLALLTGYGVALGVKVVFPKAGKASLTTALALALVAGGGLSLATFQRNTVWEDPISLNKDIIAKSPNKGRAYQALGRLYIINNKMGEAEKTLIQALEVDNSLWQTWHTLAMVYVSTGRHKEALKIFNDIRSRGIDHGSLRQGMGVSYLALGDNDQALVHLKKSIEMFPLIGKSRVHIARILAKRGQTDEALRYLEEELKVSPGSTIEIKTLMSKLRR